MYKLLLCWRYLLTRYLALACIVSVMLGVATLIVVNSVMSGFSTKLKERLHGLLSDVLIESLVYDGFADPYEKMERIHSAIGDQIEAMTATIEIPALVEIRYNGQAMPPRPVHLLGIDAKERARLGGFAEFLTDDRKQRDPSFDLSPEAKRWHEKNYPPLPPPEPEPAPRAFGGPPAPVFPPSETKQLAGVILGYSIGHYRKSNASADDPNKDETVVWPGDEVVIYTLSTGPELKPLYDNLVVADFFKSEMSEYDANYVFVPLEWLQHLRGMENRATHIQIKLKDYRDANQVRDALREMFPRDFGYDVETWEDKQGPLLAAISIEKGILNVLLFLIVGVAGFGILAIFAMIVTEKTRDIGILKALGASNKGVMNVFLGYGFLLGVVGAGLGTALGLTITLKINDIEKYLTWLTGQEIFPRTVYYFNEIPTDIQLWSVALVNAGAIAIAVLASIIPALRAALLHPVQALRYE